MSVQINTLEVENVKRIKAIKVECTKDGLTVIGGRNLQGKTSVLDAIAFALGGAKYAPSNIQRKGSLANPEIRLTLSNGLIVERRGKNSSLKVTDPNGVSGGQQLLNSFIHQFALDLPKFLNSSTQEKAKILLRIIGVEEVLTRLEADEESAYNKRHALGQIADRKWKFADEMVVYADAPDVPVSASELIQEQQAILAHNGECLRRRKDVTSLVTEKDEAIKSITTRKEELFSAEQNLQTAQLNYENAEQNLTTAENNHAGIIEKLEDARTSVTEINEKSTTEIEASLKAIDNTNIMVRANLDKAKANEDADEHRRQYDILSEHLEAVRLEKATLLDTADLPLPGLSINKGELIYRGQAWDCMSGSEQLQVATAIVRKLNPECGFVLLDKLEQMDTTTLETFGLWLKSEGLQAIATRVSVGEECSIIIEDGFVAGEQRTIETASSHPLGKF